MLAARIALVVAGAALVGWTLDTMVRTFVIPRGLSVPASRLVFVLTRRVFDGVARARRARTHDARDRLLVYWAPLTVLALPGVWLVLVGLGCELLLAELPPQPAVASPSARARIARIKNGSASRLMV